MSHFGRSGPPDIKDTFSLLVLNITFREHLCFSLPLSFLSAFSFVISFFLFLFLFLFFIFIFLVFWIGTTADDLFPFFDKYGKVVDIFIPRDRRFLLPLFLFFLFCFSCGSVLIDETVYREG